MMVTDNKYSKELKSPFLLTKEALLSLDDILLSELNALKDSKKSSQSDTPARTKEELIVKVFFKSNKFLRGRCFRDIDRDPTILTDLAVGFESEFNYANVKCNVCLQHKYGLINKLRIDVSPENDLLARGLFVRLVDWAESNVEPAWIRIWYAYDFVFWLIGFISSLAMFAGSFYIIDEYKPKAHQLLSQGINSANQTEAIAILLALQSGYGTKEVFINTNFNKLFYISALGICLVLSALKPRNILGVGLGERKIKSTRKWINYVIIGIPMLIISEVLIGKLWDKLVTWAGQ